MFATISFNHINLLLFQGAMSGHSTGLYSVLEKLGLEDLSSKIDCLSQRLESAHVNRYEITCLQYLLLLNPGQYMCHMVSDSYDVSQFVSNACEICQLMSDS